MPGTMSFTPIPSSPKQPASAATFNARYSELATQGTGHFNGISARHILAEIDAPTLDDQATPVALGTGPTDLNTSLLRLLTMIGRLAGGTGNAVARVNALTSDLKTLIDVVTLRSASAVGNTLAVRDANGEGAFAGIAVTAYSTGVAPVRAKAAGAANQGLWTGQKSDNTITSSIDSNGLGTFGAVGATTMTATTFVGALTGNASTATSAATATSAGNVSGVVAVANGGTNATTAANARSTLNVPATDGTGATGTWNIGIFGTAVTASTANAVAAGAVGTAGLATGAVTNAKIADAAVTGGSGAGAKIAPTTATLGNIADGYALAQGTPNKTVAVYSFAYYSSTGVRRVVSGNSPAFDAVSGVPSIGNQRIDLLYADDTGALGWKAGTPAPSSPIAPTRDANTYPLVTIGPILSTTTTITDAMIADARPSPTAGVGGGVGSGADLSAKPFLTVGADGTLTAETDAFLLLGGSYVGVSTIVNGKDLKDLKVDPRLVVRGTDANALDATNFSIQPDVSDRLVVSATGASSVATIQAGSGGSGVTGTPHNITLYGSQGTRSRTIVANASTPALGAGGAGVRYLCADLTGAGVSTYSIFWSSSPTLPEYKCVLATMVYDGTTLYARSAGSVSVVEDYTAIGTLDQQRVRMNRLIAQTGNVATQASISNTYLLVPSDMPRTSFTVAEPTLFLALVKAQVTVGNTCTAGQIIQVGVTIDDDGSPVGITGNLPRYAEVEYKVPTVTLSAGTVTGNGGDAQLAMWDLILVTPASNSTSGAARVHTLSMYSYTTMTSVNLFGRQVILIPWAV